MSCKPLVVAIDFGTTFSGYAFSLRHDFENDPLKISASTWIGGSSATLSLKTSSCVLFQPSGEFHSFGFDAEEKYNDLAMDELHLDWYFFRRFKMLLYNIEVSVYSVKSVTLHSHSILQSLECHWSCCKLSIALKHVMFQQWRSQNA